MSNYNTTDILSYLSLILINIAVVYFLYLQFWPYEVAELEQPMKTDKQCYEIGEVIEVSFILKKYKDLKVESQWVLVNGVNYILSPRIAHLKPGSNILRRYFPVVQELHEGVYHINSEATYRPTPFREINYTWRTNDFKVGNCAVDITLFESKKMDL